FAVENYTDAGIELWVCSLDELKLDKVKGVRLNAALGEAAQWMPDSRSLLVQLVPEGRGDAPTPPVAPAGPVVQESGGKAAPVRTYQDLLKDPHDAALFEYYATSQLAVVNGEPERPKVQPVGMPGIVIGSDPSPDGQFVLVYRV